MSGNGIARLFLTIVSAFAEFERDRIGERIREVKRRQKAAGKYSGGWPAFGFQLHPVTRKVVPDRVQQKALRYIRGLAAKGMSSRKIATLLQIKHRIRLSHVSVQNILRRDDADVAL